MYEETEGKLLWIRRTRGEVCADSTFEPVGLVRSSCLVGDDQRDANIDGRGAKYIIARVRVPRIENPVEEE